ncbi:MAG: TRAP transporter small permease subunit [SAR324 cluster bacterium]|nr:TRAP transporter small permease subunit [SAR324 cluster bacterium]
MNSLKNFIKWVNAFNDVTGRSVSWLTLVMALVTFLIVILRYIFNIGWIWMQESVIYMHGMVFMVAGGYTLLQDQHVRIDIFYRPMDAKKKALVNFFGVIFLLFPTCGIILYFAYPYVRDSWRVLEGSKEAGGIPAVFLLKSIILVFPVLVGIQGLSQAAQSILDFLEPSLSKADPPVEENV